MRALPPLDPCRIASQRLPSGLRAGRRLCAPPCVPCIPNWPLPWPREPAPAASGIPGTACAAPTRAGTTRTLSE